MEKCWFVLRHNHYPPPIEPTTGPGGSGRSEGPICLGHMIPSLKKLDTVINVGGPEPFPRNMPVWNSKQWIFKWNESHGRNIDLSANVEVPTTVAPVDVKADAGILFKRSVTNHYEFERLDTSIIQPTDAYIDDSLEDPDIAQFITHQKTLGMSSWHLYMISGLMIARGAKRESNTNKETGIRGGGGVTVPGIVDDGAHADVNWTHGDGASFEKSTDFIWAIRLMRISKGMFSSGWVKETYVKGATFNLEEEDGDDDNNGAVEDKQDVVSIKNALPGEVMEGRTIYQPDDGEDFFLVPDDLEEDKIP